MFSSFGRCLAIQAQDLILQGVVGALTDHGIRPLPYTLRMSPDYRIYDDRWRVDASVRDEPADVSSSFGLTRNVMDESFILALLITLKEYDNTLTIICKFSRKITLILEKSIYFVEK